MKDQKQTVEGFAIHCRGHQDEYCGIWEFLTFGRDIIPIVRNSQIHFLKKDWINYPKSVVPIGIGFGEYDDHRPTGRLQNTCSALLVGQTLRIANKPGVNELLGEVLWCDTKPKVFPTQLANLIKAKHRIQSGQMEHGTYRWALDAFDAIVFGKYDEKFDIRAALEQFWHDGKWSMQSSANYHAAGEVDNQVNQAYDSRNSFVTGLASIAAMMKMEIRSEWLDTAFKVMIRDAELYGQAITEVNEKATVIEVETENGPEPVYLLKTDNEHITKAAVSTKAGKASIVIVRDFDGHTCVLANPHRGMMLADFTVMVRMAEYEARTGKKLLFSEADGPGTRSVCPEWHLAFGNMLLNGSLTHPDVPASNLSLEKLGEIASSAFTRAKRDAWIARYLAAGIEVPLDKVFDYALVKK